jgi:hypothetical protein
MQEVSTRFQCLGILLYIFSDPLRRVVLDSSLRRGGCRKRSATRWLQEEKRDEVVAGREARRGLYFYKLYTNNFYSKLSNFNFL